MHPKWIERVLGGKLLRDWTFSPIFDRLDLDQERLMANIGPRDSFVENFVAKFDGRSREIAEAQHAQAVGDAKAAWADILAALDARDAQGAAKPAPGVKSFS